MSNKRFKFLVSGSAYRLYPMDVCFGILYVMEDQYVCLPKISPYAGEWGKEAALQFLLEDELSMPQFLDMVFLSVLEHKFYSVEFQLPTSEMERIWNSMYYEYIIVGMAPYGNFSIWFNGSKKGILIYWGNAEETNITMEEFMPHDPAKKLSSVCENYINADVIVKENLEMNGLPPRDLFDNYMKQFTYRYQVGFEKWNEGNWEKLKEDEALPEFDYIEETLYDGTHDKLHDGGLMKYHEAGKPKKLKVQFHVGKAEYSVYFWFEDERIKEVFDRFYGAHPDTKTDFIIKIDAEGNKYQVAMYRYGLKEPVMLADDVFQLIVFRNKFECYRSENYNQPRGAWIW